MGGKTYEAVQWLLEDQHRVLLVHHEAERQRLIHDYNLIPGQVMSADSATHGRLAGRHDLQLGVDNIDLLGWRTLLRLGWLEPHIALATETR
jgi:hypothetical protein